MALSCGCENEEAHFWQEETIRCLEYENERKQIELVDLRAEHRALEAEIARVNADIALQPSSSARLPNDYMEALRVQLDLISAMRREASALPKQAEREVASIAHLLLDEATPIYIAPWVSKAVLGVQSLSVDIVLTPEDLPMPKGFACLPTKEPAGFVWGLTGGQLDYVLFNTVDGARTVIYGEWTIGRQVSELSYPPGNWPLEKILEWRRILYAMWSFMLERRVTTVTHRGVDRPLRKQAERDGWTHEPIIQVVELRASEARPRAHEGAPESVAWACRWAVRGHWHRYHYGDGTLRARWLAPYVKGPEGKPLRAATKLFAVVR